MRLFSVFIIICSILLETNAKSESLGHVVLITAPLFGHMIPLLDFAKRLSEYHHVTYIVSASKLDILKQHVSINQTEANTSIQSRIEFIGLLDGNNDDYQVTNKGMNVPMREIARRMHEPLLTLLFPEKTTTILATHSITRPIDLIITDLSVLTPVWESYTRNIPIYIFVPNSLLFFMHTIDIAIHNTKSGKVNPNFDHQIDFLVLLTKGIICNSVFELDDIILDKLRRKSQPAANIPVLFVAPLISDDFAETRQSSLIVHIKQWLDRHWERANRSACVIYIAFGSWVSHDSKQLSEITNALKPYPFIWSLKKKLQTLILPLGIDSEQHLLLDWTPQRFILSHPAVRLFISHGGWNSLLESMSAAKPTLVWPFFADQTVNGYRLEHEFGMGRHMLNTDLASGQRIITSDELTSYLKEIFAREMEYLQNAQDIQDVIFHAKENSSRLDVEKVIKIIDDQASKRMKKHHEL
ncbi:unnamed protein product [Adineta ricciae]|uniref:UDP-glucuronosyltransferase n=1 Tax=Adineta ricciae TaxID=249248 RepID=A0A815Z6V1_ADIRI|nr:unnamed protein product [Adineta ricciae]CAF1578520.1 unnamed protein product [Adineta ricciae]